MERKTAEQQEWRDFEKEVAKIIQQYPLVKPDRQDVRLAKKLYKEGRSPQYVANFILLSHNMKRN